MKICLKPKALSPEIIYSRPATVVAFVFGIVGSLSLSVLPAQAAPGTAFYLSPASSIVQQNSNLTVTLYMNADGEPINGVQADLAYDATKLQYITVDYLGSAFNTSAPSSGGGGLVSIARGQTANPSAVPSVPGEVASNGQIIARVTFNALEGSGSTDIAFASSSQAIRNTDFTNVLASTTGSFYTFTPPPLPVTDSLASAPSPSELTVKSKTPPTAAPQKVTSLPPLTVATNVPAPSTPLVSSKPDDALSKSLPMQEQAVESASSAKPVDSRSTSNKAVIWGISSLAFIAAVAGCRLFFRRRGYLATLGSLPNAPIEQADKGSLLHVSDPPSVSSKDPYNATSDATSNTCPSAPPCSGLNVPSAIAPPAQGLKPLSTDTVTMQQVISSEAANNTAVNSRLSGKSS